MRIAVAYTPAAPDAPPEDLDGLAQRDAVAAALEGVGHTVETIDFDLNLERVCQLLRASQAELVFNLVESVAGHDRLLLLAPALFEALSLSFTGAGQTATLLTTHKLQSKRWLLAAGLPTPAWLERSGPGLKSPELGQPVIVKSVWDHGSAGLEDDAVAPLADEALTIAKLCAKSVAGREWFAEHFIDGREFNVSVLAGPEGPVVLPAAEICFVDFAPGKPRMVGYKAKWDEDSIEYQNTERSFDFSDTDAPLLAELERLSLACWRVFELRGYARVDFRVDSEGQPWILEININPCLSPDAGFAAAVARSGLSYAQAIERIVADTGS